MFEDRLQYAHRVALKLNGVVVPDDMMVLHSCDNKKCVNHKHLFLGTCQDNMDDLVMKSFLGEGKIITLVNSLGSR